MERIVDVGLGEPIPRNLDVQRSLTKFHAPEAVTKEAHAEMAMQERGL